MRFTNVLYRVKNHRDFKLKWEIASKKTIIEERIPEPLIANGVDIVDVIDVVKPKENLPKVGMPEPYFMKEPSGQEHSLWKPKTCHVIHDKVRMLEGQRQAQLLTKTIVLEGLPPQIDRLIGKTPVMANRDELLKRYILQATIWDGMQRLLPRRIDLAKPGIRHAREYGIDRARQKDTFNYNLIRLLENQAALFEDSFQRSIFRNCYARVPTVKDGDLLKFNLKADIVIAGPKPLAPFADDDEVQQVSTCETPDLHPIKYTVDLQQTNIYELDDFYPLHRNAAQPYVQTIYLRHHYPFPMWLPQHVIAKSLSLMFAFTAAQATRDSIKMENGKLQRPVTIQCVATDSREFSLMSFQLNTLDVNGRDGIKNIAWLETGHKLYTESFEQDGKVNFQGFNSSVVDRLSALHLNGLDLMKPRMPLITTPQTETTVPEKSAQKNVQ